MRLLLLFVLSVVATAGESLTKNGVTVALAIEHDAGGPVIVATFTPQAQDQPLHLYGKDIDGSKGGFPTRLELAPGAGVSARGPLSDDQPVHVQDGLEVYPEGKAVTLRLPVTAPAATAEVPVLVTFMACTPTSCLVPVRQARLTIRVEGGPSVKTLDPAPSPAATVPVAAMPPAVLPPPLPPGPIRWLHPHDRATVEAMIRDAHAAGKAVLLDFTGPSCVNCQLMAKTVLRLPAIAAAWNAQVPIEVDTDPPNDDLAEWEQQRFQTQNRPLYVRLAPDGGEARWDRTFAPADTATLERFLAFLGSGRSEVGDHGGTGGGLGEFILLAILGGLFTLVMPCTYPMIPLTINVFAKQAAAGQRLMPLALFYGAGIIACFVGLGVLITGVFHSNLATLAGHPVTNLVVALLFVFLGLSLLGMFFLRPPAWLAGLAGGARGGYLGALLMGLTFAVTAFTCTAPFAGAVLAAGVSQGAWGAAVGGMAIYSATLAAPFVLLGLSPGLLARLPRAGAWMDEFKIVGGLIEIAAAFKFLAICDNRWGWGLFGRTSILVIWAAIAVACAAYLVLRPRPGPTRIVITIAFAGLAVWLVAGVAGLNLGFIEAFFPGDAAP